MRLSPASLNAITAMVLAGGLGTRLRMVVGDLPKVLAPVAGRPFLHYILHYLRSQGVADIVLSTGHGAERVANYCQDGSRWGVHVRYSSETTPLGTGGAVKQARSLIGSNPFLVLNGDSLLSANLSHVLRFHAHKRSRLSMVLAQVPEKMRFGSVYLADDGAVTGFSEKGHQGAGLINAGIYLMDRSVLDVIPTGGNVSLERDVFPGLIGKGLMGSVCAGAFIDIGTPQAYAMAQTLLPHWPRGGSQ